MKQKQVVCSLVSIYFNSSQLGIQSKIKPKTNDSRDMMNAGFLEKGVGIVCPPHFVNDLPKKYFSCYIT